MHVLTSFLLLLVTATALEAAWYKGNTHTHTLNSDGDSTPEDVVRWYSEHGYQFLFVTDHEMITDVAPLNATFAREGEFLVLPGEEVTSNFPGQPPLAVHVNALFPKEKITRQKGAGARDTLRINVQAIQEAGAIAHVNHPNFRWQLTGADVASVGGARLLEIANMHPIVNTRGAGPDFPSAEDIWDQALTLGAVIWGVASDDVHQLKAAGSAAVGTAGEGAGPGKGWIVVRAEKLAAEALRAAIEQGDFYASTGVVLKDYRGDASEVMVTLQLSKSDLAFATKYRIQFIGQKGRVLHETVATEASYKPKGDEAYVRIRITDSNGKQAWTQPVFVDARKKTTLSAK